jgi:hypothetical protein
MQSPQDWSNHQGLQVFTVGHLLPRSSRDDVEVEERVMPTAQYQDSAGPSSGGGSGASSNSRLRVRRKIYVPGWAVPPRVLLVEDDAVSRRLSSKFLEVLGVTADIAVDGDAAVQQMCLEKYDLVLMVRVDLSFSELDADNSSGYRDAKVGWCCRHQSHPTIRPPYPDYFHDEQFMPARHTQLLLARYERCSTEAVYEGRPIQHARGMHPPSPILNVSNCSAH